MGLAEHRRHSTLNEPTTEQKTAAEIDYFLYLQRSLATVAKSDTLKQVKENRKQRKVHRRKVTDGLMDFYIGKRYSPKEAEKVTKGQQSEKTEQIEKNTLEALLTPILTDLQQKEAEFQAHAPTYTARKRMRVALSATRRLRRLSNLQREILFEKAGYKPEEHVVKKLVRSGAWTGLLTAGAYITGSLMVAAEKALHIGNFSDITDPKTLAAVGLSYLFHYRALFFNANTNEMTLTDNTINNSPNFTATSLYLLFKQFLPSVKIGPVTIDTPKAGVIGATVGPVVLFQEPAVLPFLFVPGGAEAVIARNIAGILINGSEGVAFRRGPLKKTLRVGDKKDS